MIDCKNCKYEDMCLIKDKTSKKIEMCTIFETAEKQTNADRIRSMSDEELAEFMANKGGYIACCQCDFFNHDEEKCESPSGWLCTKGYASALIQKWLQSEVEEA